MRSLIALCLCFLLAGFCKRKVSSVEELYRILDRQSILGGLFHPRRTDKNTPAGAQDFEIPVDGAVVGARFHNPGDGRPLLFFHGNGETVPDYDSIAPFFHQVGFSLFVVDYRGYGFSTGKPSVGTLMPDAEAIHHFFQSQVRINGAPAPVVMGRSLGSGPATHLAHKYPEAYAGLILESGFADVLPLLELLRLDVPDHLKSEIQALLSNDRKVRSLRLPVLLLHGAEDSLIGPENARANFAAIPHNRKKLQIIPGAGHNDLMAHPEQYFGGLANFIDFFN